MSEEEEVLARLEELAESIDFEKAHTQADELLCEFLDYCGYPEIAEAFKAITRWSP